MSYPATEPPSTQTAEVVRPFDAGCWFPIHNAVFDLIMPHLSPNAWKVLCVAIRQTWGWVADPNGDPKVRRKWDRISYSQFQAKSGIKSRATVSKTLAECLTKGYLLRYQVDTERGQPTYAYALNHDFEMEWSTGSKNEPVTGTEIEPATGSRNEPTKQRKTNKQKGDDDLTEEQKQSFDLLVNFGVAPVAARRLARECTADQVRGWIAYTNRKHRSLHTPAGFLISKLRSGEPPPSESNDDNECQATTTCQCGHYVHIENTCNHGCCYCCTECWEAKEEASNV